MPTIDKEALFADLGYRPHPGQLIVHRSKARRRICAMGARFGKTTLAAYECIAYALAPKQRAVGWIVAHNYELATRVFREVVHVFQTKLPHMIVMYREYDHLLKVWNPGGGQCEIRCKSAESPVSLLGEGLDWLCVDEFARLKPDIWEKYLTQRLIDKDGQAILISTPKGKGLYFELFRRGQPGPWKDPDYESWNLPSWANPLLNRDLIEAERERIPDAAFRQEFGGEFVEGSGSVFRGVRVAAVGEWAEPMPGETYSAGLDLARVNDYTVLVIMDSERRVVFVDRFTRLDWKLQLIRIKAALERYNDAFCLVDSTGGGEVVLEAMLEAGIQAEGYVFTNQSKSELVANLSILLEHQQITLPRYEIWPEGIEEIEAYEYSVTERGTVTMAAPPGHNDDCVCGLMLAAYEARQPGPFEAQLI